jgi:hypothetical protein
MVKRTQKVHRHVLGDATLYPIGINYQTQADPQRIRSIGNMDNITYAYDQAGAMA